MKIAVASDDGINLTGHVGRCDMFLVFDTKDKEILNVEKRENSFTMHKQGGHQEHNHEHNHGNHSGGHHGILGGLNDCQYLLCSSAGPGLITDLNAHGIETILTDNMDAKTAVERFLSGDLVNNPDKTCSGHHH